MGSRQGFLFITDTCCLLHVVSKCFVYIRLNLMGSRHSFLIITEQFSMSLPIKLITPWDMLPDCAKYLLSRILLDSQRWFKGYL